MHSYSSIPRQRNLAYVLRSLSPYWVNGIDSVAKAWESQGETHVLCANDQSSLHPWTDEALTLETAVSHNVPPGSKAFGTFWPSLSMWKTLNRIAPAAVIIHEYSPYTVLGAMVWAKLNRRPCFVSSEVGPTQQKQFSWLHRTLQKAILFCCDGVIARTPDAVDLAGQLGKPAVLAPYAISTKSFRPDIGAVKSADSRKRLIQVGSLIPRKGIDLLLTAFSEALKESPDLELVLVGTGDVTSTKHLAEKLGIEKNVVIKEFLQPPEVCQEYARSDAFILASRFDTYGVVVHEAAACSLPLLVSKYAGAARTLVQDGINGYVVDPFDAKDFAEKILRVISPENQSTFSQKSLSIALENDVTIIGRKTANWIKILVSSEILPSSEETF